MPSAFVLINVEAGEENTVLEKIKETGTVEEAYISYGVYDLIVRIKGNTMEALKNTVTHSVRAINTVRTALTLILMKE